MSTTIKPTVGRIVWFNPAASDNIARQGFSPLAAIIACVWSDTCVNLAVFDANGNQHSRTSVLLVSDDMPAPTENYAEWMPYQKGQAAKTEALESKSASSHTASAAPEGDALVKAMVDRFLGWKLPHDFAPDAGISFSPSVKSDNPHWPTGTNLLHAGQALEMFKHCLGLPDTKIESKDYADGTTATGVSPLPDNSPAEQHAIEHEIQANGLIAPCITPADIEANIVSENYFSAADGVMGASKRDHSLLEEYVTYPGSPLSLLTFCVLVLRNGTKIVGINYGPVSPSNFDAAKGREESRKAAIEQIWPLMGYELRTALANNSSKVNS